MSINDVVMSGNLVYDPKFSGGNGKVSRASFRMANTNRRKDAEGNWIDGDTLFIDVVCWRSLAEHVVESIGKGTSVVVTGRLKSRVVESPGAASDSATPRWITYYEIEAASVGVNLARVATTIRTDKGPGAARQEDAALAEVADVMERDAQVA
jgi:Single-stranded DNA-binding protein